MQNQVRGPGDYVVYYLLCVVVVLHQCACVSVLVSVCLQSVFFSTDVQSHGFCVYQAADYKKLKLITGMRLQKMVFSSSRCNRSRPDATSDCVQRNTGRSITAPGFSFKSSASLDLKPDCILLCKDGLCLHFLQIVGITT